MKRSLRPFERRESGGFPYFKLATWDARAMTWKDGKNVQETEAACRAFASRPGRYRISRIEQTGRVDLEPFEVAAN